jgi:uncharacterized membrane protein YkoI
MMKIFAVVLTLGVLFSAVQAQETEKKITRAQLPPQVEKTVAKESEGVTIKGFASETEHGQQFYEASLIVNGHTKDILMDSQGNIVEVEEQVTMTSLPTTVQNALQKMAGSGTITVIESLTKNGQLVAYEAHVKHGKKRSEIQVGPNGEKLKHPE